MKQKVFLAFFGLVSVLFAFSAFGQQARQLTVAVSPFEVRGGANQGDADTIYEIFVGELVTSGKVKVVDRTSFDAIMTEMKFQTSDWSNGSKVAQLGRALNANTIIRGQLMYLGGQLIIMGNILDINTAQILSSSRLQLNDILDALDQMPEFVDDMVAKLPGGSSTSSGTRQVQGGNRPVSTSTGIGIDVSTRTGGTLYFQNEKIATLWANDSYTIPIEEPGNYIVKLALVNGVKLCRTITINARGVSKVEFGSNINIGDEGPGGGIIFHVIGGTYKECSEDIGEGNWNEANSSLRNYQGGGFKNWRLPTRDELDLMYKNLKQKGLGNFVDTYYWSSSSHDYGNGIFNLYSQNFANGNQGEIGRDSRYRVRAVREFNF